VLNCIQHRIASCGNEQRILHMDGSVTPGTDEVEAMSMVVTFQDICEYHRTENELRRYQSIRGSYGTLRWRGVCGALARQLPGGGTAHCGTDSRRSLWHMPLPVRVNM
jgi:hypothetical protein